MAGKADNQRFAEDKPGDCACCYFWNNREKNCTQERCYYLLPEKEPDESVGDCGGCPYDRDSPCIGYCLQKILREMRRRRELQIEKEGDHYAG